MRHTEGVAAASSELTFGLTLTMPPRARLASTVNSLGWIHSSERSHGGHGRQSGRDPSCQGLSTELKACVSNASLCPCRIFPNLIF